MSLFPHDKTEDTAATWTLAQGSSWWAEGSCPYLKASLARAHRETWLEVARWRSFHWAKHHAGAAGKKIHMRLSCSASCSYGCGRCSVAAFPPSQKAASVSVVHTGGVFLSGEYKEPWLLPHDIWNDAISFFKKSPRSFVSLTAQGKQVGWVLLLTTLSHVVAGGLLNVRTSLM